MAERIEEKRWMRF